MPELPEVETIIKDLKHFLPNLKIKGVWTDIANFKKIKKQVSDEKILSVKRRAKYILIRLTHDKTLLVHQKMTGHLLYGKWTPSLASDGVEITEWKSVVPGPLRDDPGNRFIHLVFFLSNGWQLALCDMRKFASVSVVETKEIGEKLEKLGPEPLDPSFGLDEFQEIIKKRHGKIKQVLMDQNFISGVGNIYSDEILWLTGIHPLRLVQKLRNEEIEKLYKSIKLVLKKAIRARGSSYIDYRDARGRKGRYQEMHYAYQMTGTKCKKRDGGVIKKIKIGGRSAHFCPLHQKL